MADFYAFNVGSKIRETIYNAKLKSKTLHFPARNMTRYYIKVTFEDVLYTRIFISVETYNMLNIVMNHSTYQIGICNA